MVQQTQMTRHPNYVLLVLGQDKLIVEEDRRPDRDEDIVSKIQIY